MANFKGCPQRGPLNFSTKPQLRTQALNLKPMQLSINPATRCFAIHQKHQYCRKAKQSTKHDEQQQQFIIRLVKFKCYGMRFQMGVLLSQFLSGVKNAGEKIEDTVEAEQRAAPIDFDGNWPEMKMNLCPTAAPL